MSTVADLHRAVEAAITSKRLGQPVFVRYLIQGPDKADAVLTRLADAAADVQKWLGQKLDRAYVVGSAETGQVAATLQFAEGATAQVSFARSSSEDIHLMVLGNHGAAHFDGEPGSLLYKAPASPDRQAALIAATLTKALKSGRPEAHRAEDGP